jgi:cyanate permease
MAIHTPVIEKEIGEIRYPFAIKRSADLRSLSMITFVCTMLASLGLFFAGFDATGSATRALLFGYGFGMLFSGMVSAAVLAALGHGLDVLVGIYTGTCDVATGDG